ncbi:hypothetical protein ACSQ67_021658 [Phaseolus vulgaris]
MTHFKPQHSKPHIALKHDSWSWHYTSDYVQATIHKLESLIDEGSEFHQHQKSYQPLIFPILGGGAPNSRSQSHLLFNPGLCDMGNFWQATGLNGKTSLDDKNSLKKIVFLQWLPMEWWKNLI